MLRALTFEELILFVSFSRRSSPRSRREPAWDCPSVAGS